MSVVRFRPRPPPLQTARHHGGPFSFRPGWSAGSPSRCSVWPSHSRSTPRRHCRPPGARLSLAQAIQPIHAIAFANSGFSTWWAGNILFSFAAAYLVEQARHPTPASIARSLTVIAAVALIQSPSSFGLAGIAWLYALHRFLNPQPDNTAAWPAAALVAFFMLIPGMPIANALIPAAIAAIIATSQYVRSGAPTRTTRAPCSLAFYAGHLQAIVLILAAQQLTRSPRPSPLSTATHPQAYPIALLNRRNGW
ncbi:MAG: TraX family protein [Pseudomonadota bacterium]